MLVNLVVGLFTDGADHRATVARWRSYSRT